MTKVDFPKFDGEDVISWLYRVNKFFEMDQIGDDAQKIRLVSMHVFGKALNWHKQFMGKFGEVVTWGVYETHVKKRFESVFEDLVVELKNLKQTISVQVYQDSFEELLNKVELNEPYAISLLIGGLKEDIAYDVRMFKPTSLVDVFCFSKLQEANTSVSKIRHTPVLTTPKSSINVNKGRGIVPRIINNVISNKPFKKLTQQELEEKGQSIYVSSMIKDMRVRGYVGKQLLHILVDSGSTHNFLDLSVAKKMGCKMRKMCPLQVSVANEQVMSSMYECKDFQWELQGKIFVADFIILPLGGCKMVLKYLLDQRLITPFQAKWLPKLLRFDYKISYKKGSENIVADALSRVEGSAELNSLILSTIISDLLPKVKDSYVQDSGIQEKIKQLVDGTYSGDKYTWEGAIFKRKGKKGMHKGVKNFIRECDVCQRQNPDLCAYQGPLQPLPIPERVWSEISMDFIVGLPKSQGKSVSFVVVDRLSKYAHFMALSHPYTSSSVAQVFLDTVYKIHGLPVLLESTVEVVDRTLEAKEANIEMHIKE
nr:retrotransposon-related protein [Tanacetum cinerariifolium]